MSRYDRLPLGSLRPATRPTHRLIYRRTSSRSSWLGAHSTNSGATKLQPQDCYAAPCSDHTHRLHARLTAGNDGTEPVNLWAEIWDSREDNDEYSDLAPIPGWVSALVWAGAYLLGCALLIAVCLIVGAGCSPDPDPGSTVGWMGPRVLARVQWGEGL